MQEYLQHLFVKEDMLGEGEEELDEEKVKTFADFVIHEIDDNKVRTARNRAGFVPARYLNLAGQILR